MCYISSPNSANEFVRSFSSWLIFELVKDSNPRVNVPPVAPVKDSLYSDFILLGFKVHSLI